MIASPSEIPSRQDDKGLSDGVEQIQPTPPEQSVIDDTAIGNPVLQETQCAGTSGEIRQSPKTIAQMESEYITLGHEISNLLPDKNNSLEGLNRRLEALERQLEILNELLNYHKDDFARFYYTTKHLIYVRNLIAQTKNDINLREAQILHEQTRFDNHQRHQRELIGLPIIPPEMEVFVDAVGRRYLLYK